MLILALFILLHLIAFAVAINARPTQFPAKLESIIRRKWPLGKPASLCMAGQFFNHNQTSGDVSCLPCPVNTFMNLNGHAVPWCFPCYTASPEHGEVTAISCTSVSDTAVTCRGGHYFRPDVNTGRRCHACDRCLNQSTGVYHSCVDPCCQGADKISQVVQGRELVLCQGPGRPREENPFRAPLVYLTILVSIIVVLFALLCYWKAVYNAGAKKGCTVV